MYPWRDNLDSVINLLDKYSTQIVVVQMGLLAIILSIILYVYFYNRRKYHNLKHQIPASVVKNYLDSIIQNSTALKSSLFRGGGLDVDPSSIPSVMPLDQLAGSSAVGVSVGGGAGDEALKAEIAKLRSQLAEKTSIVADLEAKNAELEGTVKAKQERIEELEKLLAEAQANVGVADSGAGGDEVLQTKLMEITAERDALREDLAQYDIIEDDLADLKRLKQENEQLKSALDGGELPAAPVAEAIKESVPEPEDDVVEESVEEPEVVAEVEASADEEASSESDNDKSPEDLLSEFEKMLG